MANAPEYRGQEIASAELIEAMRCKRRVIVFAVPGTEEWRYLEVMSANTNVGGEHLTHLLLKEDARKIEAWEEFLHGTQKRISLVQRMSLRGIEVHVKQFMIRHRRLLRLRDSDVFVLQHLGGGQ